LDILSIQPKEQNSEGSTIQICSKATCQKWQVAFLLVLQPADMPVEVSRKKALATSIERSESGITIQQIHMHSIKTADVRLQAVEYLMRVNAALDASRKKPFYGSFKLPALDSGHAFRLRLTYFHRRGVGISVKSKHQKIDRHSR